MIKWKKKKVCGEEKAMVHSDLEEYKKNLKKEKEKRRRSRAI